MTAASSYDRWFRQLDPSSQRAELDRLIDEAEAKAKERRNGMHVRIGDVVSAETRAELEALCLDVSG